MSDTGKALREARLGAGQTQADAAAIIGVSIRAYIRLENGETTNPQRLTARAVADYLRRYGQKGE